MSEMRETAYLLQHVTDTSIVLIDELGRGTSPIDALCITGAVCEELIRTRVRRFIHMCFSGIRLLYMLTYLYIGVLLLYHSFA